MKRLYRLVIVSFLGPFVMTFFIVLFLLLMQFLWRYIDELVGKGLDISIIAELLLYASSGLVPLALPLAILLSSLMTFGNMGEYYELTAIKASGISLRRVMMPLVFLVLLISIGAFFFSNNVLPVTNLKMRSLRFDVQQLRPEVTITEGIFYKGLDNYSIRVSKKDPVNNMLYDIKIYDHSSNKGNVDVTIADSGRMKITADKRNMIITLWNGYRYTEVDEGRRRRDRKYPHDLLKFSEQNMLIELSGFEFSRSKENVFKNSYQMLNVSQLTKATDSLRRQLYMKSREFNSSLIQNSFFNINKNLPGGRRFTSDPSGIARAQRLQSSAVNQPTPHPSERVNPSAYAESRKEAARRAAELARPDLQKEQPDTTAEPTAGTALTVPEIHRRIIRDFDSLYTSFSLKDRLNIIKSATNSVAMNHHLVISTTSSMEYETRLLRRHEIEWHRKFTLSFACMIFLFIGAPLGAIIRKGGLGLPTVISTLLFILYYIISLTGQKFVEESVLTGFQGMWLSSIILIIAGVFLTYQATNDSAILNIDTYLNWLREKAGLRKGVLLEKKEHISGRFELNEVPINQLQENFRNIAGLAEECHEQLKKEAFWFKLVKISFQNSEFPCLVDFGIRYNQFIDEAILSQWFRIPYFQKRLGEFPWINGSVASTVFTKASYRGLAVIVIPIGLVRLIHLRMKVNHVSRNLKQVTALSSGMINLLNSATFRNEIENRE